MPITPSVTRRRKPSTETNKEQDGRKVESDAIEYDDDADDDADAEQKAVSAFNATRKKSPAAPSEPARKTTVSSDSLLEEDEEDEGDEGDDDPHVILSKPGKATPTKSRKSGSGGKVKIVAGVLVILLVVGGLGLAVLEFVLPGQNSGNTSTGIITLIAPQDFMALGASEALRASLTSKEHSLSSFEFSSRTIAGASSLSPATSAVVVSNQVALDKHSGSGSKNIAAFNTPLVFAMKKQTASELKEYGIISIDPADSSLIIDLDKLMIEVARGAPYGLSGPDLSSTDMGNLLWCLMNSAMENSGLDEQLKKAVLYNISTNFVVELSAASDIFRSLANDTSERRVIAVPESAVVLDSSVSPGTWEDSSQNSLVIAYPRQSAMLSFHVVTFDQNGAVWFDELKKLSIESLFNNYGLRPSSLEAPHLGTVRLQAGLRQTVAADTVMPGVDRFNELLSMLNN